MTITARQWAERRLRGPLRYQLTAWLNSVRRRGLTTEQRTPEEWAADHDEWRGGNAA